METPVLPVQINYSSSEHRKDLSHFLEQMEGSKGNYGIALQQKSFHKIVDTLRTHH